MRFLRCLRGSCHRCSLIFSCFFVRLEVELLLWWVLRVCCCGHWVMFVWVGEGMVRNGLIFFYRLLQLSWRVWILILKLFSFDWRCLLMQFCSMKLSLVCSISWALLCFGLQFSEWHLLSVTPSRFYFPRLSPVCLLPWVVQPCWSVFLVVGWWSKWVSSSPSKVVSPSLFINFWTSRGTIFPSLCISLKAVFLWLGSVLPFPFWWIIECWLPVIGYTVWASVRWLRWRWGWGSRCIDMDRLWARTPCCRPTKKGIWIHCSRVSVHLVVWIWILVR